MKTDFNFPRKDLIGPVIFRPEFNQFGSVDKNQAWSLFFTAGQEDKALGREVELGQFFTNVLMAIGTAGALWAIFFSNSFSNLG
jgi:hypothetical protein